MISLEKVRKRLSRVREIENSSTFHRWISKCNLSWVDTDGGWHGQNFYFTPEFVKYGLDDPPKDIE